MAKFAEAEARWFKNIYICRKCGSKLRAPTMKVLQGKSSCRKCQCKALKPKRKK